jgi:hypothetical protein
MVDAGALTHRRDTLRRRVSTHKATIRHAKKQLQADAASLEAVERECRARGIGFTQVGETHAQNRTGAAADHA